MSADVTSRLVQLLESFPEGVVQFLVNLKGLSHEIDFKINFFTELGLTKGRGWFLKFLGCSDDS
jgi:hypothetical protein